MKLPRDLLSGKYTRPRIFLCETDKTKICPLNVFNFKGDFKFNSLSEISFEVGRTYNDFMAGENKVNPYYNKIEALRLLEIEGFGYFEIQGPKLSSDGIKEVKEITAYSLEYTLSQKYLTNFYINTGEIGSVEVTESNDGPIVPVTLYNQSNHKLSLLHLILEKTYGWTIGYVDSQLKTLSRTFSIDRMSVYDFIMNEICDKFNCYVVFDTINNTINFYAESLTAKFIGDGKTNEFVISPPFYEIGTVSIDGYKTTQWEYDQSTGIISLTETPEFGTHIEVVDKSLKPWETDVIVAFDNLSDKMDISYDADSIKTVLSVTYGDDNDIRETNLGLPYLTDISYYYTVDWMGQELYDAYTLYLQKTNSKQLEYTNNSKQLQDIAGYIDFEENRLSLGYSEAIVGASTTGTYYIRGGSEPQYYYTEVSLPADYNANTTYYSMLTTNLAEKKVENLYNVFKEYFMSETHSELEDGTDLDWEKHAAELQSDFKFMESKYQTLINTLKTVKTDRINRVLVKNSILIFLDNMWNEIGRTPLKSLYYETYKKIQVANIDAGWSQVTNPNYPLYYPVTLMLQSIDTAIHSRDNKIKQYEDEYNTIQKENIDISNELLLSNNFTEKQLIRLNSFLREDELKIDDIVETEADSILDTFKNKQHAMESGRIELAKISQPKLQFSMSMANIYAIPEFEAIINQFQLGKLIKVRLRQDYIKQSRLLEVHINFDDLADFSCDFGDLTNLRTQSDIHADLLASAISAGKQVATNSSYWTKGSDKATTLDLSLQQGLLDTVEALKSSSLEQNCYMDKYGIHCESNDPNNPNKIWMVNDKIVYTDDNFKTSKSVFGKFIYNKQEYYGVMADAVIGGYVQGSNMVGGTIKIGEQSDGSYAFEVREDGSVVMSGGGIVDGFVTEEILNNTKDELQGEINKINKDTVYRAEVSVVNGSTIISSKSDITTLTCKFYEWNTDNTNSISATSHFRWKRISDKSVVTGKTDAQWNAMPEHQDTKTIYITADDIVGNTIIYCEISYPETFGESEKIIVSNQVSFSEHKKIDKIKEWYLATSQNEGVTTSTAGWTEEIQYIDSVKKYLWNYEEVVYSLGESDISKPVIISMYGQSGRGISSITEYYAITTDTIVPESATDWVLSAPELTPEYKYLWNYEVIQYTDNTTSQTSPAIIGVYGDSGIDAVTFEIYSVTGFVFKENTQTITLNIAAFDGVTEIKDKDAVFQWSWWDESFGPDGGYRNIITTESERSIIIHDTDEYATASFKCTMTYNDQTFTDYVSLSKETVIYTSTVKFFDGSNILHAEDLYIVAYLDLYRNNKLIETIQTSSYCHGLSSFDPETNIITPPKYDETLADIKDNDLMYFIINDTPNIISIAQAEYDRVVSEAREVGYTDFTKVVFGNIDTNNRQIIAWNESNFKDNETALNSYGYTFEELGGSISTVMGSWDDFGDIQIAYSPMLQTSNGAVILSVEEVNQYIWQLIDSLQGKSWTTEELLALDAAGLQQGDKFINKIIADVGSNAASVSEQMHFAGKDGAIAHAEKNLEQALSSISYDVILGQYNDQQWHRIDSNVQYEYENTLNPNDYDNIIVISKESINKSQNIDFTVYKDGEYITSTSVNVIDSNDPIISDEAPENPVYSQLWLDTSTVPYTLKIYTQIEDTDAGEWVKCTEKIGGAIFTSQPSSYSVGDLWILADGEECTGGDGNEYKAGSMLKATTTSKTFKESHWIDADAESTELKKNINQYFKFTSKDGLIIGQQDNQFYVNITSKEMGFYDNSNPSNPNQKVVSIGETSAKIKNLSVEENATFDCNVTISDKKEINLFGNFILKKELNGSMSLAMIEQ